MDHNVFPCSSHGFKSQSVFHCTGSFKITSLLVPPATKKKKKMFEPGKLEYIRLAFNILESYRIYQIRIFLFFSLVLFFLKKINQFILLQFIKEKGLFECLK
jgi:hypothetical protein